MLFVHAHPDDESIATGGTIAALVDGGAAVTVLTCTRGELGEVIPPEVIPQDVIPQELIPEALGELVGHPARIGSRRSAELSHAMTVLGVTDHRYLGDAGARRADLEPRRYFDSGMVWGGDGAEAPERVADDSFSAARFAEVAADIATVIEDVHPDAVVSYDENGGYGHPDHVMAHDAALRAAEVAGIPFFAITERGPADLRVDVSAFLDRKRAAIAAHRSQVVVEGDRYRLSSGDPRQVAGSESFTRVWPQGTEPLPWRDQGLGSQLLSGLLALLVGIAVGGIATVNHQVTVAVAGIPLPVGIAAALGLIAAMLVGLRLVFGVRTVAVCAAVGILGAILFLSMVSPGGSVLVPANVAGYLLSFGPVGIAIVALGWPAAGTFRRDRIVLRPEPRGTSAP
ncbi:hypothetical protein BH09ACT3_BH09ACT3_12640 [soil metagenome]